MKKYLAEFIGIYALVFFGTGAIIVDQQTKGSLGLLALGYMGLYLWRSKRMSAPQTDNDQITKGYSYSKISNISENE